MIEKIRQQIASIFEVPDEEYSSSMKLGPIFWWLMAAGIIGGIMPFIWKTNQPMLVAISSTIFFIILTIKPTLKRCIKNEE